MDNFLSEFFNEAEEQLGEFEASLTSLKQNTTDSESIRNIFRIIHTIKGSSEYVGVSKVAEFSHTLESFLDKLRDGRLVVTARIADFLFKTKDRYEDVLQQLTAHPEDLSRGDFSDLLEEMSALSDEAAVAPVAPTADADRTATEPIEEVSLLEEDEEVFIASAVFDEPEPFVATVLDDTNDLTETADDAVIAGVVDDLNVLEDVFKDAVSPIADAPDFLTSKDELTSELDAMFDFDASAASSSEVSQTLDAVFGDDDGLPGGSIAGLSDDFEDFSPALSVETETADRNSTFIATATVDLSQPAAGSDTELEALEIQPLGVEQDVDLFVIYLAQTETEFQKLFQLSQELYATPSRAPDLLDRLYSSLKRLRAATNYMNYQNLVAAYDVWMSQTDKIAKLHQQAGVRIAYDFILKSLCELGKAFGNLKPEELGSAAAEASLKNLFALLKTASVGTVPTIASQTAATTTATPATKAEAAPVATAPEEESVFDKLLDSSPVTVSPALADFDDIFQDLEMPSLDPEPLAPATPASKVTPAPAVTKPTTAEATQASAKPAVQSPDLTVAPLGIVPADSENSFENILIHDISSASEDTPTTPNAFEQLIHGSPNLEKVRTSDPDSATDKVMKNFNSGSTLKRQIRVDSVKIDTLITQSGELVVVRSSFAQIAREMLETNDMLSRKYGFTSDDLDTVFMQHSRFDDALNALGRLSSDLQESIMQVRMLPISNLFERFPRAMRDLQKAFPEKKIALKTEGENTELDRMIIDEIASPMIHLIRNAVDHGLESVVDREAAGKPATGTLLLNSYHESNHVVIEVRDDGRGLNVSKIEEKARAAGVLKDNQRLSAKDLTNLVTSSGFSTSETVTTISGRGVGLDAVKKNIEKLNGSLEIISETGKGTTIKLKLPLTLAIIQSLLVRVGENHFTFPLSTVSEVMHIAADEIEVVDDLEVIVRGGTVTLPLIRLATLFDGLNAAPMADGHEYVVVVSTGLREFGVIVDQLIGQEEVVIKPLDESIHTNKGLSGATILGDGGISLILDVYGLAEMILESDVRAAAFGRLA